MRDTPCVRIDGAPSCMVGDGTYGTVWTYPEDASTVIKFLRGHEPSCPAGEFASLDELLVQQELVMLDGSPGTLEDATARARATMWMPSTFPIELRLQSSGRVTIDGCRRTRLSRWGPLVLHTDHGVYPLFRDADLVMTELRALFPARLHGVPGIVPAEVQAVTVNETDVRPGIVMPRLVETHAEFFVRRPPRAEVTAMLRRWALRIVPLVTRLLDARIVLGDIQVQNIMLDATGESCLVDPDSIFRESSAHWLEPAVGGVSLIPPRLRKQNVRFHPDVLRYAMVYAALVSTVPYVERPTAWCPAWSRDAVNRAHAAAVAALTPETRHLVETHLGDTTPMAERFGELVFPRD